MHKAVALTLFFALALSPLSVRAEDMNYGQYWLELGDEGRAAFIDGVTAGLYSECIKNTEKYDDDAARKQCIVYTQQRTHSYFLSKVFEVYSVDKYKVIHPISLIENIVYLYGNIYNEKEFSVHLEINARNYKKGERTPIEITPEMPPDR